MRQFFDTLFGDKPPESYILIWKKGAQGSAWFKETKDAAKHVVSLKNEQDVWVGVGTSPDAIGAEPTKMQTEGVIVTSNFRCKPPQIVGIPGVWLDLDTLHPCHHKTNLPETEEQVEQILSCMRFDPSIVIDSGHGRQYWWLFKEFWTFDTPEERTRAALLAQRVNYMFRDHARTLGFGIDSTFNLDRVLRIPGTMNCKEPLNHVPVKMLVCNDFRYNPDVLEDMLPLPEKYVIPSPSQAMAAIVQCEDFDLNPLAEPPLAKFEALCAAEPDVVKLYNYNPKGLKKKNDTSASAFDLALANYACAAGWKDQEVVNLLIRFRVRNNIPLKTVNEDPTSPLRLDYYRLTLSRAKNRFIKVQAEENLDDFAKKSSDICDLGKKDQVKVLKAHLTDVLGTPIIRLIKYVSAEPKYRLITPKGDRTLGTIENLTNQRLFRNHLSTLTFCKL